MARAFLIVLDSVGVGSAPDAARYGDEGADTVGHIAHACASRNADRAGLREGALHLPHLTSLGFGEACRLATGHVPPGLEATSTPEGRFACAAEISAGKDTPSGHWEIAGAPARVDWHYFPHAQPCFSDDLIAALRAHADLPGILGNRHASGTQIIEELGTEHMRSGKPICYTSADSVFQIAAHEETFGLNRLYAVCKAARALLDPLRVGRVIARPFIGDAQHGFVRTANRHDYTMPPEGQTILSCASEAGRKVVSIGKIADIFAQIGTGDSLATRNDEDAFDRVLEQVHSLPDGGLVFANLNDFDTLFGHRRDVAGYAAALERFDRRIPALREQLQQGDLVVITADHGCDPTWRGTDHTREFIPVIAFGPGIAQGEAGRRRSFSDIAATLTRHLGLAPLPGDALWH
jgi:phosphopentomutase